MPVSVRRYLLLSAAVLAIALLIAGAMLVRGERPADASHRPGEHVGVLSNFRVQASNGYANLPEFSGQGDGIIGMACTGAAPLGGPGMPAMVVTNLRFDLTHLRVVNANGTPLNGEVVINCIAYARTAEGAATAQRLERWAEARQAR
jgi:hypothetical protein